MLGHDLAARLNEMLFERVEPMGRVRRLGRCRGSGFRRSNEHERCSEDNKCALWDTHCLEKAAKSGYLKDQPDQV